MSTILAIDDDITALSNLTTTLEGSGYKVERSSSIAKARAILDEKDPDLIVLEVDADDSAGWELLRDVARYNGPPTIVVTRRGREEEVVDALNIGAVDVLPKPFRSNELLARVRSRLAAPAAVSQAVSQSPPRRIIEEPVFMPQADEASLLEPTTSLVDANAIDESLPLGRRLNAARQRRKLTLVQVNLDTKVPIWYLQAMEEERFALLPRGPATIDMLRTYSDYLRLDTAHALADFRTHHDAGPFQPLPSLGGAPLRHEISPWTTVIIAVLLALVIGMGAFWYFAQDEVRALGTNLYGVVVRWSTTGAPPSTIVPTLTPPPIQTPLP